MTNPTHPVYIVSKGRSDTMLTSRSLARMKVPHFIAIEPQDQKDYENALVNFNIKDYVTLLVAPFSNHGDGPGRARNWVWDHAIANGAKMHWVMDDNITDFYRLHMNKRIRVESGVIFKAAEDFIDRFENVPVSGFQYRFFCAPNQKYPPFVLNTRIYSCLLIDNNCEFRWRGRYNEDTDLSLRVLKAGKCTLQFNAFLQGKAGTQQIGGGNTAEFYSKDALPEEYKGEKRDYGDGTYLKSKMLYDMHPDVTKLVWKYDRWHHYVDYSPFEGNRLIIKESEKNKKYPKVNNYGMKLVKNFKV